MSMQNQKITEAAIAANGVQSQPDKLTGTAAQNKKAFDNLVTAVVRARFNALIDELTGADAAGQIGIAGITGLSASNVQDAIEELLSAMQDITQGSVADGSITLAKLAPGAVTTEKLGRASVTAEKIAALAITAALIANKTITGSKIADGTITSAQMAADAVKLTFTNKSVAASAFVSNSTYSDFPYRAAVALTGVTAAMVPEVFFGLTDAMSGNFAPVAESYAGGIYIYAAAKPSATITIPTILCWR